ncbi:MAG: tRNA pseudouridine(55) synthase TruB [Oscillospiraceae bacterium]|nr:tRNA pseudouridine(55) synthase TruB [Oscillospiraceae bacterium]
MAVSGLLLVDKEEGWTSQDCVAKLRGILRERRIGHAGTLDPLATGLLVVLVGRATRAAAWAEAETKEYVAAFRPGIVTDTQDITGNVLRRSDVCLTEAEIAAVLPRFLGPQLQIPPMYSAIKINGQKLYDIARRGGSVERTPRPITIYSLDLLGQENEDFILRVRCSRGTYIRTLCNDLGEALSCGGCMAALRRTAIGDFRVEAAKHVSEIRFEDRDRLLPIDTLFSSLPALTLSEEQERRCRCGNEFSADAPDGKLRLYAGSGEFLALGEAKAGIVRSIKSFFEV